MRKPLIIGHSYNTRVPDPKEALDPSIPGSSGERLMKMSGLDADTFRESFARVNTSPAGPLPPSKMRVWAQTLVYSGLFKNRSVVILGAENARYYPWPGRMPARLTWQDWPHHKSRVMWVPHTSGLVHFWNDPANRRALADVLAGLATSGVRS